MSVTKSLLIGALEGLRTTGYLTYAEEADGSFSVHPTPETDEALLITSYIRPEEVIPLTALATILGPKVVRLYLERRLEDELQK